MRQYYVYILSSFTRTLYIGVTNNLQRRLFEHQRKQVPGFTAKYNVNRLVHYEAFSNVWDALAREKQLKSWSRRRKEQLIESTNPQWEDVSVQWKE
jgi:putative endonuclease